VFQYRSVHAYSGTDTFWFVANDGQANSASTVVRLTIQRPFDSSNGLPYDWRQLYQVNDPLADPDGDGANNLSEYLANTNPLDPASVLRFQQITYDSSGRITLTWLSTGGTRCRILSSDQFGGATSTVEEIVRPLAEEMDPADYGQPSTQTFVDRRPLPAKGARFYRLEVLNH
jgi:hypothetical protein